MSTTLINVLDHIIHLVPPGTVDAAGDQWRKLGFNVITGGTHADGLTANALVVLKDGVYLELIAFTQPVSHYAPDTPERRSRENHWWASIQPGWIDFAFLSDDVSAIVNERARSNGSDVKYFPGQRGGRLTPNGTNLEWVVTFPDDSGRRGAWPFFCGDLSPREWRIPVEPPANAQHPSKATGIAYLRLLADEPELPRLSRQLTSILGSESTGVIPHEWTLATPSTTTSPPPVLNLDLPRTAEEREFLAAQGAGLYEVAIRVEEGGRIGEDRTPYGKIVFSPA